MHGKPLRKTPNHQSKPRSRGRLRKRSTCWPCLARAPRRVLRSWSRGGGRPGGGNVLSLAVSLAEQLRLASMRRPDGKATGNHQSVLLFFSKNFLYRSIQHNYIQVSILNKKHTDIGSSMSNLKRHPPIVYNWQSNM